MLQEYLTDPAWLAIILTIALPVVGAAVRWLYRPWKKRKERRESERSTIYALVRFLEDRRALYSRWAEEQPAMVVSSVRDIRRRLAADIEKLDERSAALPHLTGMQAACRRFLTPVEAMSQDQHDLPYPHEGLIPLFTALSELRGVVNTQMDHLRRMYGIEKGPEPEDPNPFIGRYVRTIYVEPPSDWQPKKKPEGGNK